MNSSVRLGVSPATAISKGFYGQRFWGFISLCWNPGLHSPSCSLVVPPGLSTHKRGTARSTSRCLTHPILQPPPCLEPSPTLLPVSAPPTCLDECFFFNSLVVRLFYAVRFSGSSGYLLFLNLLLSFFWCVRRQKVYLPSLHLGWKFRMSHF